MVAIGLPVLLITAGVAIDFLRLVERQGSAQAHIDAAALGAARVFIDRNGEKPDVLDRLVREKVAQTLDAADEDFGDSLRISVDVPGRTVAVSGETVIQTAFLSLASFSSLQKSVSAVATAEVDNQPVCILALKSDDGTGIEFSGQGEMKAKKCVVWSNATGSQSIAFDGNGKVSASRICAVGRVSSSSRFGVKPAPEGGCAHVDNPMADWQPPEFSGCDYTYSGWISRTTAQLSPGVYCGGLRVDAKHIFLKPGIYVVKDGPLVLRGESRITGKGIGIYLAGEDARLDIDGKSKVEIHSDTTGPMAGIVVASSPDAGREQSSITGRSDLKIGGVIYLPTHELTYWGESDTYAASPVTTIIGHTIEIGGDAYLEVMNDKAKAKYAPVVSTGNGSVQLVN